jgi:hypothetical protein
MDHGVVELLVRHRWLRCSGGWASQRRCPYVFIAEIRVDRRYLQIVLKVLDGF